MTTWYILPNGNIKHANGIELQPEKDWLPTDESAEAFAEGQRALGHGDVQIIKTMMDLALDCERWVKVNLS
jgi:hypothetical protein